MTLNLKNKRIIITGAGGIIGTALSQRLLQAGAVVIGIAHRDHFIKNFEKSCQAGPVNAVVHLAGQGDAHQCELDPALAIEENIKLTVSVLEASVKGKIPHLIFPSTSYIYGTDYKEKIREDFVVHPRGIYALTKLSAEMIIQYYAGAGRINADILRIGNVYGPQSKPNTVIGKMISQSQDRIMLGGLAPVRDFIYIDDVVEALVRLVASPHPGSQVLNLSMGQGFSIREVAKLFCDIWELPKEAIKCQSEKEETPSALVLNNQSLFERLGWHPSITLKEGLKRIHAKT